MLAGRQSSISQRRVLGAAAAIPFLPLAPVRAEPVEASSCHRDREPWDRNLGRYRALAAGAKRAAETGWFRAANDLYYRKCEDPEADHDAAFDRLDRAEDLYWRRCTEPLHESRRRRPSDTGAGPGGAENEARHHPRAPASGGRSQHGTRLLGGVGGGCGAT